MRAGVAFAILSDTSGSLSPLKGYCCLFNALHGRGSCSTFGKRVVLRSGVLRFCILMKLRLAACRHAAMAIEDIRDQTENGKTETDTTMDGVGKYCLADALTNVACCLIVS